MKKSNFKVLAMLSSVMGLGTCSATEQPQIAGGYPPNVQQDIALTNRSRVGGTFIADYFAPFLDAHMAIENLNRSINAFNAMFPSVRMLDGEAPVFTELFNGAISELANAMRFVLDPIGTPESKLEYCNLIHRFSRTATAGAEHLGIFETDALQMYANRAYSQETIDLGGEAIDTDLLSSQIAGLAHQASSLHRFVSTFTLESFQRLHTLFVRAISVLDDTNFRTTLQPYLDISDAIDETNRHIDDFNTAYPGVTFSHDGTFSLSHISGFLDKANAIRVAFDPGITVYDKQQYYAILADWGKEISPSIVNFNNNGRVEDFTEESVDIGENSYPMEGVLTDVNAILAECRTIREMTAPNFDSATLFLDIARVAPESESVYAISTTRHESLTAEISALATTLIYRQESLGTDLSALTERVDEFEHRMNTSMRAVLNLLARIQSSNV
ncbi:MAG: hypothetical protein LBR89_03800 [Holosporales bacterium]|jgi:hypothetical protein|nr:hypothetical protein [Holosporales bacterium]